MIFKNFCMWAVYINPFYLSNDKDSCTYSTDSKNKAISNRFVSSELLIYGILKKRITAYKITWEA